MSLIKRQAELPHLVIPKLRLPRPSRLRKALLACGVASSLLYLTIDVIGTLRYEGYSFRDQQFSELLAQGSPVRTFMIGANLVPYTALVTAFGVGVWKTAGTKRAARVTGALLIGYAVLGAVTGTVFRMNTREVLATTGADAAGSLHVPGTMVMSLAFVVGMGFASTLFGRGFRWYTYGTIAAMAVFAALVGRQVGALAANEPTPWMGVYERANIYGSMLWIAVLGISLLCADSPPRAPHDPEAEASAH